MKAKAPLIVAHRGASTLAPENTLAAFKEAVALGADGVELDVRLSRDGIPVVIHDATLTRTAGIRSRVSELTAEELSRLDAGSWFNARYPRRSRVEFAAEGVPSLRSALDSVRALPGPIYIELKCDNESEALPLVAAVRHEIEQSPQAKSIIVESFYLEAIAHMHGVLPDVQTAALFAPKMLRLLRKEKYVVETASSFGANHLSVHKSLVSKRLALAAEARGIPVTVWTVNTARWVSRAVKYNLYAVITDDPSTLLKHRDSMR